MIQKIHLQSKMQTKYPKGNKKIYKKKKRCIFNSFIRSKKISFFTKVCRYGDWQLIKWYT